jgi:pSer/pThr/pTyr-binding forkhead associated (FHA) protein
LFRINLVLRNGPATGKRIPIKNSEFLIGRAVDCDLQLSGDKVSRLIRVDKDGIAVVDLGSRNGTFVNGKPAKREQLTRVWHHDQLQIGGWLLRASLRDETGAPVLSTSAKSTAILDELDEIQAALESGSTTWHELGGENLAPLGFDEAFASTAEMIPTDANKVEPTAESEPVLPAETKNRETASGEPIAKPGPSKLPEHLLPKKPVDSQAAADAALRKLFQK